MHTVRSLCLVSFAVALVVALAACHESATPPATVPATEPPEPAVAGLEGDEATTPAPVMTAAPTSLLAEADRELSRMKTSSYSHHTHVDEAAGAFEYDCSGFLGYALGNAAPDAIAAVRASAGRRPRSSEIVAFLEAIPPGGQSGRWTHVARVADLVPGDVIVWRKPAGSHSTNTGHTMIVHGAPSPDATRPGAFVVPILDSTETPHGAGDARTDTGRTGLGTGEIVLLTDASGAPIGYRWSRGARSPEKATTIALGRVR